MNSTQEKYYRAYFQIHQQGKIRQFVTDTYAANVKTARENVEAAWRKESNSRMYRFEIYHTSKAALKFLTDRYENVFVEIPVRK